MCGIAGFLGTVPAGAEQALLRAAAALRHRGPDGTAIWQDAAAGIGLAHTRLAIIDLSENGAQPMHSRDGRLVLIHNGEIYNHRELRAELRGADGAPVFRGSSDTETLLEACLRWGVPAAVGRLSGMFAFALWDRRESELYLVRDRLGIKPLYWSRDGTGLRFGSELKALAALWRARPDIDRDALADFLRYDCVPAPHTIYKGVHKLQPGHFLRIRAGGEPQIVRYWDLGAVVSRCVQERRPMDVQQAAECIEARLGEAVTRHLISDVPLGAFLSGGVDSSTIVALMQARSTQPVRTYTVGFPESSHDEAGRALRIARHLGTAHTPLNVTQDDAAAVIPQLAGIYDEPFGDSSQIPTFLIAKLTRAHVTVALSGDGGDELFGGYNRHVIADTWLRRLLRAPLPARKLMQRAIRFVRPAAWNALAAKLPVLRSLPQVADKLYKLAAVLDAADGDEVYRRLISRWTGTDAVVIGGAGGRVVAEPVVGLASLSERMQFLDTVRYLPDDILSKVDRATMAASLECRVPYLDPEVIEAAWSLPPGLKVRDGQGKWILRRVLRRYLPADLVEGPKYGFSVPLDQWLRGRLRDWAESLLDSRVLERQGLLAPGPIRERWAEHLSGRRNWQHELWNVLMFQSWYARWIG